MQYAYPCVLEPEEEAGFEGWFNVSFPDLPGALTCALGRGAALENAEEVLELVLESCVDSNEEIPRPSPVAVGQELVAVRPLVAAKLSLYTAMREQNITKPELAERLGIDEEAVDGLLNSERGTPISQVIRALQVLGRRLVVADLPADSGVHFGRPAGDRPMEHQEFIRRVRRYALANDLEWRIVDPTFAEEEEGEEDEDVPVRLEIGDCAVTLPDGVIAPELLAALLEDLKIDRREF